MFAAELQIRTRCKLHLSLWFLLDQLTDHASKVIRMEDQTRSNQDLSLDTHGRRVTDYRFEFEQTYKS